MKGKSSVVLLVEDELQMRKMLADNLTFEQYQVYTAESAEASEALITRHNPDIIILDVMLPGESGFDFCQRLRREGVSVPIIFLTAKSNESDKVLGLEWGADDYVTKPFSLPELLARVKALLRRAVPDNQMSHSCQIGANTINFKRRTVTDGATEHFLTHYEVELLKLLLVYKGQNIDRTKILATVWGENNYPSNRTVDNYIVKLRQKIEKNPKKPQHILTVHGTGYRLEI